MFRIVIISVWTLMNAYVFWRTATLPAVARRVPYRYSIAAGVLVWGSFFIHWNLFRHSEGLAAQVLEVLILNWLGVLFLVFVCLLAADILTGFGFLFRKAAPQIRGLALILGLLLSCVAFVQGLRPPVVTRHEITLNHLPPELDGTRVAAISDTHLGSLIGKSWLQARADQIREFDPDLIAAVGDMVEGHGRMDQDPLEPLRDLAPPLGLFAVNGNHENHGGQDGKSRLEESGIRVLDKNWVQAAPGLVVAGIDDAYNRRGDPARAAKTVEEALAGRPEGAATIFLSHRPANVDQAARLGADLMLSGHTHNGQIWPFNYLAAISTPYMTGRYRIRGMDLLVGRGTGTWGPRMRLWRPGEILFITLRSPEAAKTPTP